MFRILVLASFLALATLFNSTTASARTWTSRDGRTISAKFVRMHMGDVVLVRSGRVLEVPFEKFCEQDQDYIRDKLTKSGKDHLIPSPKKTVGGKKRAWTNVNGREITASFVRISGNLVILNKNGKDVKVALDQLCTPDQEYAKAANARTKESREKEARRKKQEAEKAAKKKENPGNNSSESELQRALREDENRKKNAAGTSSPSPSHTPPYQPQPTPPYQPPSATPLPTFHTPPQHTPSFTPPVHHDFSSNRTRVLICLSCKKQLPSDIKPGDNCPKCGAYLSYKENEDGTRSYAGVWKNKGLWTGIFIFVIATVVGALVRNK